MNDSIEGRGLAANRSCWNRQAAAAKGTFMGERGRRSLRPLSVANMAENHGRIRFMVASVTVVVVPAAMQQHTQVRTLCSLFKDFIVQTGWNNRRRTSMGAHFTS